MRAELYLIKKECALLVTCTCALYANTRSMGDFTVIVNTDHD